MHRPKLSVIIFTLNEEVTLPLALASLQGCTTTSSWSIPAAPIVPWRSRAAGCHVAEHPFENYAVQRNWAFDHLPIRTPWTLCSTRMSG
jgi:hypothetical protein